MTKFNFFKTHALFFRKILGVIIVAAVSYMIFDESIAVSFAKVRDVQTHTTQQTTVINGVIEPYPAPALAGISAWINSSPLELTALKSKVVLVDFWTYSCINCIRTLPYLNDWHEKYHKKGLVIIGVHTPEFEFEKKLENVKNAVIKHNIHYAVALDNDYQTWRNFNNRYWPAHYLIDKNGYVVYQHFGEGEYDVTENNIRYLLGLDVAKETVNGGEQFNFRTQTPETYLGYARADRYASPEPAVRDETATYSFPETLADHTWALQGAWTIKADKIIAAQVNAALKIHFTAGKVYIVMGNATQHPIHVKLSFNGESVVNEKGKDVMNSGITVDKNTLYEAIILKQPNSGILQLISSEPGLEIYTFTFG